MSITHIKIGTRLTIGFSILLIFVSAIAGIAYWRLQGLNATITEMIDQAIAQMDQVTQQNAALVEEAAAAAESLQDQAGNLAQVVSVFKMSSKPSDIAAHGNYSLNSPARLASNVKPRLLRQDMQRTVLETSTPSLKDR